MSTHNIGFYEDLTKIIFELSSNTHLISSAAFQLQYSPIHYVNMPTQYTEIFMAVKQSDNFQMKKNDFFLVFAQNIDCGYLLEPFYSFSI